MFFFISQYLISSDHWESVAVIFIINSLINLIKSLFDKLFHTEFSDFNSLSCQEKLLSTLLSLLELSDILLFSALSSISVRSTSVKFNSAESVLIRSFLWELIMNKSFLKESALFLISVILDYQRVSSDFVLYNIFSEKDSQFITKWLKKLKWEFKKYIQTDKIISLKNYVQTVNLLLMKNVIIWAETNQTVVKLLDIELNFFI